MARGNKDNLISIGDRTTEEQREITSKGGKRSGEVRREKKGWRELAEIIGQKTITITNADGTKETVTYDAAAVNAMYQKIIKDKSEKAFATLAKLRGEMEDKITLNGTVQGITVTVDNSDTEQKLGKLLNK